ncbi:hypothetical protein MTR67_011914 [Solanum verrucosum]|uniref:Transposase-associated domain-containing protein n=1 Tax=Solanum verrucosum TaxID=315347 RepID=A0AAF0QER4_SOLVR|nr:hypothetical protein MTR67_011914 [Solanum verrucosum]
MDKSWLNIRNRVDQRYRDEVEGFLNWTFSQSGVNTMICCPCRGCMNTVFKLRIDVRGDLLKKGFWDSYKVWDLHGEVLVRVENSNTACSAEVEADDIEEDDIIEMIHDGCGYMGNNINLFEENEEPNMHAANFYKLLEDAQIELYPGCTKASKIIHGKRDIKEDGWHKEENIDDGVLRRPSDSIEWKSFDERYPSFSSELRNARLGLASDGFQPFGNMSSNHSIWPVVLVTYNLPPWDCMKDSYFMMPLLIPGPKSPGNDIDVYLQPMIEELKELWDGVDTYDAHTKSNFLMRVALMWTINDFAVYGNISGWSTKGKLACPCCHIDTQSISLCNKLCYMGHRRFLPMNHPWRKNRVLFDGKVEMGFAPSPLAGHEALMQIQELGNVSFGKGKKRKRNVSNNAYNWRKKSIFFQLPYWKSLKLRHNLDVMHIERNVSDNILLTVMSIVGKTKDTLKSRYDLVDLGIRQGLDLIEDGDTILLPVACYALSSQEKLKLCEFLANLKVPDAFSSNISRCVNVLEKKIHGLKCHDHHVLLQDILPIAIRGLLPKEVCEPIIALGKFFKNLYSKCLTIEDLDILEAESPIILCKLQMVFPPVFFDVMIHLPIHLASEAKLGRLVQYRDMYPIER